MFTETNNGRNNEPDKNVWCQRHHLQTNKTHDAAAPARLVKQPLLPFLALSKLAMTWSCLGTGWRGFSTHMSCMVTLRPLPQRAPLVRKMTSREKQRKTFKLSVCMRAQNSKHQCTSTSGTVVCSRYSTVYYQTSPTKTDGVSESVQCVHERAICDTQSQMCPPVLAQRCASCELASDLERRTGVRHMSEVKTHSPQSNCRRSKCASTKHLSTHMVPAIIRWTPLARLTHKNCDGTHLHGNPLRTVSIRHQRNKRSVTIPQMPHERNTHTQQQIWSTNPHIKSNFSPLVKHNFVTIERSTLTKTHRTRNIRHMRQTKKTAATLRR